MFESVVEELAVKQALFAQVEGLAPADAILASNTSGLPTTAIAERMRCPEQAATTHFWNPPHLMPLEADQHQRGEQSAGAGAAHQARHRELDSGGRAGEGSRDQATVGGVAGSRLGDYRRDPHQRRDVEEGADCGEQRPEHGKLLRVTLSDCRLDNRVAQETWGFR